MFRHLLKICLLVCVLFAVCSCGQKTSGETNMQTEVQLQETEAETSGETVVAVSRSNAQLWLLAGGQPAGVTEDALDLEGLDPGVVSVGTISEPNLEAILALTPDIVMLAEGIPSQETLQESLLAAGIDCRMIDIGSFEDYEAVMKELTEKT